MKNPDWDIYRCFVTVARSGGLTGAAQATGLSPATVGRRMLELEERMGRSLFIRSQTGYVLTGDGRFLFEQLQEMEAAARKVESWQKEGGGGDGRPHRGRHLGLLADCRELPGDLHGTGRIRHFADDRRDARQSRLSRKRYRHSRLRA